MNRDAPQLDEFPEWPRKRRGSRRRMAWIAVALLACAGLGGLAMTLGRSGVPKSASPPGSAATFIVANLRSGEPDVSLDALRGKPVVVNFWASWCAPCRREMPSFAQIHATLGDRVTFLGIDNKDVRDAALEFARKTGVRYASGFDPKGSIASRYGVSGMPATIFLSADGAVLESRVGELSGEELKQTINRLYGVS